MPDLQMTETAAPELIAGVLARPTAEPCEECLGSGGWYRYEPALDEPTPGRLYLACMHCRGSGVLSRRG